MVVLFGIFIYLYFRTLYFYLVRPSKKNRLSLENLSSYGNFLAFYFIAASVYGLQSFLTILYWELMLGLLVLIAIIIYQVFWANEIGFEQGLIYIILGCLVLIELAWSISFLTLRFYILGLILAVAYYVLIGLTRFYLLGKLNQSIIKKYLIESLGSVPHLDNPDKFSIGLHLLIRDDETGIEYTVSDIDLSDTANPKFTCYRYSPNDDTTYYLDVEKEDFDKYSLA